MKKKCFTPQNMGKLRYLSAVTVSRDGRRAACVCSRGDEESGAFFSHLLLADLEKGTDCPAHNDHFNLNEDALLVGIEMIIRTALLYLNGKAEA